MTKPDQEAIDWCKKAGIISESEQAIDDALLEIDRAQRVSKRIKAITE